MTHFGKHDKLVISNENYGIEWLVVGWVDTVVKDKGRVSWLLEAVLRISIVANKEAFILGGAVRGRKAKGLAGTSSSGKWSSKEG